MTANNTLSNFYGDRQLRKHITAFMAVFSGLKVAVGTGSNASDSGLMPVDVMYGSRDRVVDHVISDHTGNKPVKLPIMSVNVMSIDLDRGAISGRDSVMKKVFLPLGGVVPDDVQLVEMVKPTPYKLGIELSIHASNNDHMFQIMEQIFMMFNPNIEIQISDSPNNRASKTNIELQSVNTEDNYPAGNDHRLLATSMVFTMTAWIASPVNFKDNVLKEIQLRIDAVDDLSAASFDTLVPISIKVPDAIE